MPIRLCQKCGLKVLIDESQAGTNPFYCQRCTTAMKGQENSPAPGPVTPVRNPTPSPVMANRSEPAGPVVGAAKPATVRVLCPYCKASFNGRVPQKPARGSCPVCQKELILLPNGDIKPSAGFDLNAWQSDQAGGTAPAAEPVGDDAAEPAAKESNTRMLVKKYAAAGPPPAAKLDPSRMAAKAPAETEINEEPAALPGWLDDGGSKSPPVKAQPETDTGLDAVAAKNDSDDLTEPPPPPPPPPPARARAPIASKNPSVLPGRPPAKVEPAPEPEVDLLPEPPPPPPPPPPPGPRVLRSASGERRVPAPAPEPVSVGGETSGGKVLFALILALLPIGAAAGLLASPDVLKHEQIKKFAPRFSKGLEVLHTKMFPPIEEKKAPPPPPPPPEAPKEEPPKADPQQQKKDGDRISNLFAEIKRGERDLKQSRVAASPEQLKDLEKVAASLEEKKARYAQLRETYQKMYGTDYDPEKQ